MKNITRLSVLLLLLSAAVVFANCKKKAAEGEDTNTPQAVTMTDEELAKAKKLFQERTCFTCHGNEGKGDGPAGMALNPRPRNFSKLEDYKQGTSVEAITTTIEKGVDGGKTGMVPGLVPDPSERVLLAKLIVTQFQKK